MFELGLFMGALGKERCFAMPSDTKNMKLPSDFAGVTLARYQAERDDGNLIAAVSPACTLIRNEIKRLGSRHGDNMPTEVATVDTAEANDQTIVVSENPAENLHRWGIELDRSTEVGKPPDPITAWFHNERFCEAFPGVRGSERINSAEISVKRLQILLRDPLKWVYEEDDGLSLVRSTPIWWWRGLSNCPVDQFRRLATDQILFDCEELRVKSLVAVNTGAYWQSFVYVETSPSEQTGLYEYEQEYIENYFKTRGPYPEEYGEWRGTKITRAEYDDGAAIIDGSPVRTEGAELRIRFLTPYNFLIASQGSPINNTKFDIEFQSLMDGILLGSKSVDDLMKAVLALPKRSY